MKTAKVAVFWLALLAASGFGYLPYRHHEMRPLAPANDFALSETELRAAIKAANEGDGAAALKIAKFYIFSESDANAALPWLRTSAKFGNADGKTWLAHELVRRGDVQSDEYIGLIEDISRFDPVEAESIKKEASAAAGKKDRAP